MSRAMGSSCVFTCLGAASWHGGRVMLVFGARAAAHSRLHTQEHAREHPYRFQ